MRTVAPTSRMVATRKPSATATTSTESTTPTTNVSTPSPVKLGLYERSIEQRHEREIKLKALDAKLMEECTFTPKTSTPLRGRVVTPSSNGESVFDRLYRSKHAYSSYSNQPTPVTSNKRRSRSVSQKRQRRPHNENVVSPLAQSKPQSERSKSLERPLQTVFFNHQKSPSPSRHAASSSVMSSRVESLYEHGVRKMRARPSSNAQEREIRELLQAEREKDECTFYPFAREPRIMRRNEPPPASQLRRPHRRPAVIPFEIIVIHNQNWRTPRQRQDRQEEESYEPRQRDVSPLNDSATTVATEYGSI